MTNYAATRVCCTEAAACCAVCAALALVLRVQNVGVTWFGVQAGDFPGASKDSNATTGPSEVQISFCKHTCVLLCLQQSHVRSC